MDFSEIDRLWRSLGTGGLPLVSSTLNMASLIREAGARRPLAAVRRAARVEVVARDTRPVWQQRGWKKTWAEFVGYYRTRYGSWEGKATESPAKELSLFIRKPPECLRDHSHWACFRRRLGNWYFVHTYSPVLDLSSGILEVERILTEAHQ